MANSTEPQSKKWLIIFLIYADFTTNEELPMIEKMKTNINNMLGDIITTPIDSTKCRVFVVMNSIKFHLQGNSNKVEDRTLFYSIEKKAGDLQNKIVKCELINNNRHYKKKNGKLQLQKPEQLAAILKKTNVQSDEEVLLNTWDHGSAFGIFRKEKVSLDENAIRKEIDKDLPQYPFLKLFWDSALNNIRFRKFRKIKESTDAYTTIQLGHSLFKYKNEPNNVAAAQFYMHNKTFNKHYSLHKDDEHHYKLNFDKEKVTPEEKNTLQNSQLPGKSGNVNEFLNDPSGASIGLNADVAEILKNSELAEAIERWLGLDRKLSVLMMTNCWMMNLHTMYALKDRVKCLVAPQGNIDCPGYNIKDILNKVNSAPHFIQPKDLAITCIETFENPFAKAKSVILNTDEPHIIDEFKIFAVDLEAKATDGKTSLLQNHITSLSSCIDVLIKELGDKLSNRELRYLLKYVRSVCFDFSNNSTMMIDIINWGLSIIYADGDFLNSGSRLPSFFESQFIKLRDSVFNKNNNLVLKSTEGNKIYISTDPLKPITVINLQPTGYSFFFPLFDFSDKPDYKGLKDNVCTDGLLNNEMKNWKKFLKKIDPKMVKIFNP